MLRVEPGVGDSMTTVSEPGDVEVPLSMSEVACTDDLGFRDRVHRTVVIIRHARTHVHSPGPSRAGRPAGRSRGGTRRAADVPSGLREQPPDPRQIRMFSRALPCPFHPAKVAD